MRTIIYLLILLVLAGRSHAQSKYWPGGVAGARIWYQTDTTTGHGNIYYLNYHPSHIFDGGEPMKIDMTDLDLSSASCFTVYRSTDSSTERGIWYMTGHQKTSLVLTTSRMADLASCRYMNYTDVVRSYPKVNTYIQQKQKDSSNSANIWYIGGIPSAPRLPIRSFKGIIPELIIYDRALSGQERLQVASYLALKYGVTLSEPNATYLNSTGARIWDGLQYSEYHHNIAGLGRDDSASLLQTQACSSNYPELLAVSGKTPLANLDYLLWGDNGQPLTLAKRQAGIPGFLQKKWLMISPNNHPYLTDIILDTRQLDVSLPASPVYWLVIDRTGQGDFSKPETEYIRMTQLDAMGKALFQHIEWNLHSGGKEVYGIIPGQALQLAAHIDSPSCANQDKGNLEIKVLGGQAPYQLSVISSNGTSIDESIQAADMVHTYHSIAPGKYWLRVSDAAQSLYTDSFYINNSDGPPPLSLGDSYELPLSGNLALDAAADMPTGLSYSWTGPDNFQSLSSAVVITHPGVYTLTCSKNGCRSLQDIRVDPMPKSLFSNVSLFPNLSTGTYYVKVTLDHPAPVAMTVYTIDGRTVAQQNGFEKSNYLFTGSIDVAGEYEIVLRSGLSTITEKLLISK